jgi:hypothetical protein
MLPESGTDLLESESKDVMSFSVSDWNHSSAGGSKLWYPCNLYPSLANTVLSRGLNGQNEVGNVTSSGPGNGTSEVLADHCCWFAADSSIAGVGN